MALREHKLTGTTAADGSLTVLAETSYFGFLYAVEWIDGTFDDGVDGVLSATYTPSAVDKTLLTLTDANADAWYHPRVATCGATGAADGGTDLPIVNGTLKLVIAQGGNAKTGGAIVYVWER